LQSTIQLADSQAGLCKDAVQEVGGPVWADGLPVLRTGALVGESLRARLELAAWFVPNHKRAAQTARRLPPGSLPRLRQAI